MTMRVVQGFGAAAVAMTLTACGSDQGPLDWIDARASVVHCTSAGRDRMPPVLLDLPVPRPPTGLYARRLDPMALDDLGFQRDTVACAMLLPPDVTSVTSAGALEQARAQAQLAAGEVAGMCACEAAARLEARALLPQCVDRPTRRNCKLDGELEALQTALEPVVAALAETTVPLVHWRLVGKTDRPGWFARQRIELVERHTGGSTVFVDGEAVPRRDNGPLIEALLGSDDVVAVARQDSGQALLVVRELGKTLVFDHFEYAVAADSLVPLLPYLDNASVQRYQALLAKPSETRKLRLDPTKGNLVEVDVSNLETVDAAIRGAAAFAKLDIDELRALPERRIELIAAQAPFGREGRALEARVELTPTGVAWASLLTSSELSAGLDVLELETVELAPIDEPIPYRLAATRFERSVVYGLEHAPDFMSMVEARYPGSVGGTARAWSFTMPLSDLEELTTPQTRFRGVRSLFAEQVYEVGVEVVEGGAALRVEVAPK